MTVKFGQRYFPIVLHFAGDSTITRCFPFLGSISKLTDDTFGVVFEVATFLVAVDFGVGMISAQDIK